MQMNKYFHFFYLIAILNFSTFEVQAAIWGPSTYEECVVDIVKSANNSDYSVAQSLCRNQFPKLPNLSKKKNVQLACVDVGGKFVHIISITNGLVSVKEIGKVPLETTLFTKESIMFKGTSSDKRDKRKVTIYGKIDAINAFGTLVVEYDDKKSDELVYEFNCVEKN